MRFPYRSLPGRTFAWRVLFLALAALPAGAQPAAKDRGQADVANVVVDGNARFTVLTPTLVRMEYADDGTFEDRPSYFAVQRDAPPQQFTRTDTDGWLEISTARLRLRYRSQSGRFTADNLTITVAPGAEQGISAAIEWKPGLPNPRNLGGTVRTLDGCRGPVDLGQGILSRDGWFLLDDSTSIAFGRDGIESQPAFDSPPPAEPPEAQSLSTQRFALGAWAAPRRPGGRIDWYFFGYGHDYAQGLKDLTTVGGRIPLPPRFALGSWYSRYWPYAAHDFLQIADDYAANNFPLDVMVIDMDWHLDGWTGFTWNPKLIPDPDGLLKSLHERALKVALNLHPADGVGPQERAYPEFARSMGVDDESKRAIPFDIADRRFARNYFDLLLHPLEAQGVDFWWMDWQQQRNTAIPGLDPLPWLNHLHFADRQRPVRKGSGFRVPATAGRQGSAPPAEASPGEASSNTTPDSQPTEIAAIPLRGLCFSRWGGWGDHRHPVQFSGDAESTWTVLKFEVPFTATAGNVGAAYWSHDLGGHWSSTGRVDPELYTRWLQFGAFSPAMRVHSTRDAWNDRRPWLYSEEIADAVRLAYDLRYRLMPYIYAMARKCYDTGLPLVRPMYLMWPNESRAYEVPGQFMFGDDILVAPVTEAGYGRAKMADVLVWFPAGNWYDLTTDEHYTGATEALVSVPLDGMAAFARGGAPIPMNPRWVRTTQRPVDPLIIRLYPGPATVRELYEDDGETIGYLHDQFRRTPLVSGVTPDRAPMITIGPAQGGYVGAGATPTQILLELCGIARPQQVLIVHEAERTDTPTLAWSYDPLAMVATVGLNTIPTSGAERASALAWTAVTGKARSEEDRTRAAARARGLVQTVARALRQLTPDHPVAAALSSASRGVQAYYAALADPGAAGRDASSEGDAVRTRAEDAVRQAVQRLLEGQTPDESAALRALTGTSLTVATSATPNPSVVRVSAQLGRRPEAPAPSPAAFTVQLAPDGANAEALRKEVRFNERGQAQADFDVPIDSARLNLLRGTITADPLWQGLPLRLTATFEWNAATIKDWLVLGPLRGGHGPEAEALGPEKGVDRAAHYDGRNGGQISWTSYNVKPGEVVDGFGDVVHFKALYNCDNATAFAATTLESESEAMVDFLIRHDDGAIVWVNGAEVYRSIKPRALFDGENRFSASLHSGENAVLVKVDQLGFEWGLRLSVAAHENVPLPAIRVQPPEP